jgi:hypothetical protein
MDQKSIPNNETSHQIAFFTWVRKQSVKDARYNWIFHCPNGEKRDWRTATKLKVMGVKKGVLDIWVMIPSGGKSFLAIELKIEGGRLQKEQEDWVSHLNKINAKGVVAYGFEDARKITEEWISRSEFSL